MDRLESITRLAGNRAEGADRLCVSDIAEHTDTGRVCARLAGRSPITYASNSSSMHADGARRHHADGTILHSLALWNSPSFPSSCCGSDLLYRRARRTKMNTDKDAAPTVVGTFPAPPPLWRLTVVEVTSVLVVCFRKTRTAVGSLDECEALYKRVLNHNSLAGWWAFPIGIFWNAAALSRNKKALSKLRELAAAGTVAAGWHPDPSGRHLQRYWDGQRWTDRVNDQTSDPV
jgi:hypothetical protein